MQDPSSSISRLKADWFHLHDLDRAQAVAAIHDSGTSIRRIARDLGFSESNLRHLLSALDAPSSDQALARQHLVSTRELVRRGLSANARRAERHRQARELERTEAAQKAAELICNWLEQTQLHGPSREMILNEVRCELAMRDAAGAPTEVAKPHDLSVDEIIRRCRPKRPLLDDASSIDWYANWLFWWAFNAFRDNHVRWRALDLALERQRRK